MIFSARADSLLLRVLVSNSFTLRHERQKLQGRCVSVVDRRFSRQFYGTIDGMNQTNIVEQICFYFSLRIHTRKLDVESRSVQRVLVQIIIGPVREKISPSQIPEQHHVCVMCSVTNKRNSIICQHLVSSHIKNAICKN